MALAAPLNLLSRQNNLFYPTAKAAEDAAAAKDPELLFAAAEEDHVLDDAAADDEARKAKNGEEWMKKTKQIRVAPPMLSFEATPDPRYDHHLGWLHCVALSESRTVFVDHHSRGAFLYDADARRVVTMPTFPSKRKSCPCRVYFPVAAAGAGDEGDDTVYAMDGVVEEEDDRKGFKFQAMVHRIPRGRGSDYRKRWYVYELPRPPYLDHHNSDETWIASHAMAGDDVICVSMVGHGTYCFDTASRAWSKAGDWALPFAGKVERDGDLGVWLVFVNRRHWKEGISLLASGDLFTGLERESLLVHARDDWRPPVAPSGWHEYNVMGRQPQLVGLGSGEFCVTQFFETVRPACSICKNEDTDQMFAVFTGVEVVRRGGSSVVSDEQNVNNGNGNITAGPTELRVIIHKSKRYMLTKGNTIEYVL